MKGTFALAICIALHQAVALPRRSNPENGDIWLSAAAVMARTGRAGESRLSTDGSPDRKFAADKATGPSSNRETTVTCARRSASSLGFS
jgi:hypothetical protein